jgi:AraC-like DNA-binding protein
MATPSRPPAAAHEVTVSSRVVIELVRAVERSGVARTEFLRAAGIEPEWLHSDDFRMRREDVFRLCQVALEVTRDPAFGLHWGEWITTSSFNLVSHLLAHASNLRSALDTLHRFGGLVTDEVRIELVEKGDTAEIRTLDMVDQPLPIRRLTAEMVTLGVLGLLRHFGGPKATVSRACFQYAAPDYRSEYTRIFAGAERFDQPYTGVAFARALLHAQSPQKDEDLYTTLSDLAARRLQRLQARAPYSVRVLHHLLQQRAPQQIAMGQVARGLGVSVRSLHRRLTEEGRSYASLASEAAALRAKRLLDEGRTIHETAHAMGFSKVSSFHRAFRRWTGVTPGDFSRRVS